MKRKTWLALSVVPLVAVALPAAACPNCIAAQDSNVQWAFLIASVFMTALPLVLIGSGVFWLWRRATRIAAEEASGVIRLPTAPARPRSVV